MYNSCAPFNCGNFLNISYPFWNLNTQPNYCGRPEFTLDCQNGLLTMEILSQKFRILDINQSSQVLRIARDDLWSFVPGKEFPCPKHYINVEIDSHFFHYTSNNEMYTILYECGDLPNSYFTPSFQIPFEVMGCYIEGKFQSTYVVSSSKLTDFNAVNCKNNITVPGKKNSLPNKSRITKGILIQGFEVRWNGVGEDRCRACTKYGGRCGYKRVENSFLCLSKRSSASKGTWNLKKKIITGVISTVLATLAVITSIYFYKRYNIHSRNLSLQPFRLDSQRISKSQNFGVEHFIFKDLYKATNHFDKKLGNGGSAEVFYGKLPDGREVAVKRLFNGVNNEQHFLNEINILAGARHSNLILLHGCTSPDSRRALIVYEYVPNGSLSDHLHGDKATPNKLPWDIRMRIAMETADALSYLHLSHIIHRDIKTSNILLDAEYHVKVADFGLSRLFPNNQSRVLTIPKGTLGYVDPEYSQTNALTYKSDVFSFGVVLIELITSLRAYDRNRKDDGVNLYDMAIKRSQDQTLHDIVDHTLGFDTDSMITQMINGVAELAFRCLQSSSDMRPTMEDVLKELKEIQPQVAGSSTPNDEIVLLNNDLA
ncbi:LEAF RUST 10 DISEASE-RESISTANCE LOCUS RECEPTOR-LIKE PROTEIN KINASE-like 1.2 isoform X2 [Vicia villosa]|nr:LEAF RUST 10 DISEASE-RESISTANCE LOCUS RECEPTOR-LIKE PROTEIN KINASE-like 1.2 isoform X2 [Vicia villosa]